MLATNKANSGRRRTQIGGKNELTVQSQHLLGDQWRLFNRPSVKVKPKDRLRRGIQVRTQHHWFEIQGVEKNPNGEGLSRISHFLVRSYQVMPSLNLNGTPLKLKLDSHIRWGGFNLAL
jgi:hypothetical protein